MDTRELLHRVKKIEIKTRRITNNIFAGEYHSAFKGRGLSFSEVREYSAGDDIRDIDWNITAKTRKPHIKTYEEERELNVMLLIDVSASLCFGTQSMTQKDLITEIAATIAFSAMQNNDKVGAIFFSEKIEKFIPPKKGKKHILFIISQLLNFKPASTKTAITTGIEYLAKVIRKRCTAFILSDFIDMQDFSKTLSIVGRKHDIIALQVYDEKMTKLPNIGLLKITDPETGRTQYVDTANKASRLLYEKWWNDQIKRLNEYFNKSKIDIAAIATNQDYVNPLRHLFAKRIH